MNRTERLAREADAIDLRQRTRRHFLSSCATGLGAAYLADCAGAERAAAESSATVGPPPRVKRVIYLHMIGAPSQLELFDYKPELARYSGSDCPAEYLEGQRFAFIQGTPKMLGPQYAFERRGESGAWVSELMPHFGSVVDEACFIKTMQTDQFNHGPAQLMVHTGSARVGSPSMGSWVTWGLGSENEDLPGYIVLLSGGRPPRVGGALWSSGFLPSVYQGVQCRSVGDPVLNVANPDGISRRDRRATLDALDRMNRLHHERFADPETLTRIEQAELAFRMQMTVPEAMSIDDEPEHVHQDYGTEPGKESFANNCLLARRLAERGVRFIQLFDWGWDTHGSNEMESLSIGLKRKTRQVDRPIAALLRDLRRRGMMDDTLVVWGGEFGRTSMMENRGGASMKFTGRDHNPNAFTIWMAGGGVRAGHTHGETDDMGYLPATAPVHLRDFHATLLHLMGVDHRKMTFPFQGLNQKLTGVKEAEVVREVLA